MLEQVASEEPLPMGKVIVQNSGEPPFVPYKTPHGYVREYVLYKYDDMQCYIPCLNYDEGPGIVAPTVGGNQYFIKF